MMPIEVQIFAVLLVGLCVGSFLNVVIVRLPRGRSLFEPSSRCGFCRSSIPVWMNIPVVSFIISAGQCVRCGFAFSARYMVVEILTAILFLSFWAVWGWTSELVIMALFGAAFVAVSFIDAEFRIIPDVLSLGGWIVALLIALIAPDGHSVSFMEAFLASLVGYGAFWMMSRLFYGVMGEEGLGGGDVKLLAMIGALLGWPGLIGSVLVGSLLGSLVGLLSIFVLGKTRRFPIPFGPFLVTGALAVMLQLDF